MVSGFGRLPPPRNSARGGFLTPIRSPAAPEPPTSSGASRKIGGKTACGPMRPGPMALRYLCGRSGYHLPGRHSRDGAESRTPRQHSAPMPILRRAVWTPNGMPESRSLGGVAPPQPTPTGATPTPTTAIARRWRINRPGRPYLRSRNPKRKRLWST